MQKIRPCLWFNDQGEEAVELYTSLFPNSSKGRVARYNQATAKSSGKPEGSVMTVEFMLAGQEFLALNGGPEFTFSPAVSFSVHCDSREEIDKLWEKFSEQGKVMMPLEKYPFSERYGWVQDKYGVSWQLILAKGDQKITPSLLFVGDQHGKAEEAMKFYTGQFPDSKIGMIARYEKGEGGEEGKIKYAQFTLAGQEFIAMENNQHHPYTFTMAISFMVNCQTQEEVDGYWEKLSSGGGKEWPCGWLTDKYGVAWQITPVMLIQLMGDPDKAKSLRVMEAMLKMKKLDIATLEIAAEGRT